MSEELIAVAKEAIKVPFLRDLIDCIVRPDGLLVADPPFLRPVTIEQQYVTVQLVSGYLTHRLSHIHSGEDTFECTVQRIFAINDSVCIYIVGLIHTVREDNRFVTLVAVQEHPIEGSYTLMANIRVNLPLPQVVDLSNDYYIFGR